MNIYEVNNYLIWFIADPRPWRGMLWPHIELHLACAVRIYCSPTLKHQRFFDIPSCEIEFCSSYFNDYTQKYCDTTLDVCHKSVIDVRIFVDNWTSGKSILMLLHWDNDKAVMVKVVEFYKVILFRKLKINHAPALTNVVALIKLRKCYFVWFSKKVFYYDSVFKT